MEAKVRLGINEPIELDDFIERFIAHNTVIHLYDSKYRKTENEIIYDELWVGMDWQICIGCGDEEYFINHPDIKKCPYIKNNVVSVRQYGTEFADEIVIVIDNKPQNQALNQQNKSSQANSQDNN